MFNKEKNRIVHIAGLKSALSQMHLFAIYHQLKEGLQEIQMEDFSACIAN